MKEPVGKGLHFDLGEPKSGSKFVLLRRFSSGHAFSGAEGLVQSQHWNSFMDVATVVFWLAVVVGILSLYLTRRRRVQRQARVLEPGFWEVGDEEKGLEDEQN